MESSKLKKETKKKDTGSKSKSKSKAATPKTTTVLDKIIVAIRALQSGSKGSSRVAITKYVQAEFDYDNANALKAALKKGVSLEKLVQTGQSFRVASDPISNEKDSNEIIQQEDIKIGKDGPESSHGDAITVAYVGTLDNGYQFDKAGTFTFVLGIGEVIKGWDAGLVGMKKGGKRKIIIPSKFGYGKRGCKPDIPPNATLHFTVIMKQIKAVE